MKQSNDQKFKSGFLFWFAVIALIVFYPFYHRGISLIWNIDGVGQYYPAFLYTGQWVKEQLSGIFSFSGMQKFDLKIALGENVISALNYYGLCDPLNIPAMFSNINNGAYVFSAMVIFRMYLSGVAFKKYCKYMSFDNMFSFVAALCYAFSGFSLCGGLMYIQFLAPYMYFPLILIGIEKAFKEKKYKYLVFSSLYASLSNLYFMYMIGIYLISYCIVRAYFIYGRNIKDMLTNCLKCALSVIGGFVLSLPVNILFIRGIMSSARGGVSIIHILSNPSNWIPSFSKIISYGDSFVPVKTYALLTPVIVYIVLAASVFLWKTRRSKQCALAVIAFFVSAALPITYFILSGFDNSYNRWYLLMIFTLLVVFCANADELLDMLLKKIPLKKTENHNADTQNIPISNPNSGTAGKTLVISKSVIFFICIINIALAGFLVYSPSGTGFSDNFIPFEDAPMYADSPVNYSDTVKNDKSLYRISNDMLTYVNHRPDNVAMINGYNGLDFWLSVINENTQEIVNRLGIDEENLWRGYGLNNSAIYESFAGVKYYLWHDNKNIPPDYKYMEDVDFYGEKWKVYENPHALNLIYALDAAYYENSFAKDYYNESMSVFENVMDSSNMSSGKDELNADVSLDSDGYIICAVPYSDRWDAYIDGEKTDVFKSDILYPAVKAPRGSHRVEFKYR